MSSFIKVADLGGFQLPAPLSDYMRTECIVVVSAELVEV